MNAAAISTIIGQRISESRRGRNSRTRKWSQNHGGSHLRRAPQYETREPGSTTEPGSAQESHVGTHAMRLAGRQSNQVSEFRTRAAHFETTSRFASFELQRGAGVRHQHE